MNQRIKAYFIAVGNYLLLTHQVFAMKVFVFSALGLLTLSGCTMLLIDEIDGGHSPMMILNGHWNVLEDYTLNGGDTVASGEVDSVWFNAKKDVGGYCEGTWYGSNNEVFYWQINKRATDFTTKKDEELTDWNVISQEKNTFIIERNESGNVHTLHMEKVWEE